MASERAHWRNRFNEAAKRSLPLALLLTAPFAGFLKFQEYGFIRPEVLLCVTFIAGVSLILGAAATFGDRWRVFLLAAAITFFLDIQMARDFWFHGISKASILMAGLVVFTGLIWLLRRHADQLATMIAATVLVTTTVMPSSRSLASKHGTAAAGTSNLPLMVHIVLDEQVGIDALDAERTVPDLQADLRSFYHSLGFHTFDAAYSEFRRTEWSLSHLLNLRVGDYHPGLLRVISAGRRYALADNEYFTRMSRRGYSLRVYQTEFLPLCLDSDTASCETYSDIRIGVVQTLPLPAVNKAQLIAATYLRLSGFWGQVGLLYDAVHGRAGQVGLNLPLWTWFYRAAPLNAMTEMKRVAEDVSSARRGELFFAHVLLPHSPNVYGDDCSLLPFASWTEKGEGDLPDARASTKASYIRYRAQVRCTLKMIRQIVDAIPSSLRSDAIVMVHGDHGSRIGDDVRDNYSTLFAVRLPGLDSVSDHRLVSTSCILRTLVEAEFKGVPDLDRCSEQPAVFVTNPLGRMEKKLLDPFSDR